MQGISEGKLMLEDLPFDIIDKIYAGLNDRGQFRLHCTSLKLHYYNHVAFYCVGDPPLEPTDPPPEQTEQISIPNPS